MTRRMLAATLVFAAVFTQSGEAYLRISQVVNNRRVFLQVSPPSIRYFVSDRGVPGVSSAQLREALISAGQRWQSVPSSSIAFESIGLTSAQPGVVDGQNTIGFLSDPEAGDLLGLTLLIFDEVTGNVVETDIYFNSIFDWSVEEDGEEDRFDFESIAVHEMGHMLGLDHSGLGQISGEGVAGAESVMFPFSFNPGVIAGRNLTADDIAGVSSIYPDGGFSANTGTIHGRVQLEGRPVFGAHVMAFHPGTGTMIAGFSFENGEFSISGLPPGRHLLRIEPIDDGDPSDYFEEPVDVEFTALFFNRLVSVQPGATTPRVDITVAPK
jgi:hypothetical protein